MQVCFVHRKGGTGKSSAGYLTGAALTQAWKSVGIFGPGQQRRCLLGMIFAGAFLLTPARAAVHFAASVDSGQTAAELLASRKQTGKGSTKAAAYADAMTKVPAGVKITRTVYSGSDNSGKWLCHVYYETK